MSVFDLSTDSAPIAEDRPVGKSAALPRFINERSVAAAFSIFLIALVLLPLVQNLRYEPRDGFPFPYYPMFGARRDEVATMRFIVVRDEEGNETPVPHKIVGRGGMNQIRKRINRAVRNGNADALCEDVARRLERSDSRRFRSATTVAVVTAEYRLSDYINGQSEALSWRVEAERSIQRREP